MEPLPSEHQPVGDGQLPQNLLSRHYVARRVLKNPTTLTSMNNRTHTAPTARISTGRGAPGITLVARRTIQRSESSPANSTAAVMESTIGLATGPEFFGWPLLPGTARS